MHCAHHHMAGFMYLYLYSCFTGRLQSGTPTASRARDVQLCRELVPVQLLLQAFYSQVLLQPAARATHSSVRALVPVPVQLLLHHFYSCS